MILDICPRLYTGSYAEITIDKITCDKNGQYTVTYSSLVTKGTTVLDGFYDGDKFLRRGESGNGGFVGWPEHGSSGVMFTLDPESSTVRRAT